MIILLNLTLRQIQLMAEVELDRLNRLALNIKETIETSTFEEREQLLDDLFKKWIIEQGNSNNPFDYLVHAMKNFELDSNSVQMGLFNHAYNVVKFQITYLNLFMIQSDEIISDQKKTEYSEKFTKLFKVIIDAGNAISSSLYLMSSMTLEEIGKDTEKAKAEMFRYSKMDYEILTPCQSLILYLLEQLQRKQYRRYVVDDKGMCYSKIYNEKGQDTHAWKSAMTIKNFVIDNTRKEFNADMWRNLTASKENLNFVTRHLTECLGPEFEDLAKDRHIFSFNNGVYITKVETSEDDEERVWTDQWIPFEGPGAKKIGASIVSSKYFDLLFEDCSKENGYEDWFDIVRKNCPTFKSVMEHQQWDEEVQKWMCILMGRMTYNVGELDDWQVFIFLLGLAATGKSLAYGTKVMMYNGSIKEIQNIKPGDLLMGDDSKPRRVIATQNAPDQFYRVRQSNGDDYIVNGDHILSLKTAQHDDIIDVSVKDYLKFSNDQKKSLKGYKVPVIFTEKQLLIDPYLVGNWLGECTNGLVKPRIFNIFSYFVNQFKLFKFYCIMTEDERRDTILQKIFKNHLLIMKRIPYIYRCNSQTNQFSILAGIIDACGEYIEEENAYELFHTEYTIAKDTEFVARCLGYVSKIEKEGDMWKQSITGNNLDKIPCVNCNEVVQNQFTQNQLLTDITVEPVEPEFYLQGPEYNYRYSIQIDGNQRFLLADHTVTHNSTIIENILRQFYDPADIGILGNNAQKMFALSGVIDKKIVLAPEIKGNWSIDQAELQSMVTGEAVSVNIKFKQAASTKFTAHIAIAGNVAPDFQDNAGSMSRRTVVFPFGHKVKKSDQSLGRKIQKELTYIMQACNKGYLEAIHKYGTTGIWEVLPELFKSTQESMAENSNSLTHFLRSDLVEFGSELYCREKVFIAAFNDHCKESHFSNSKWTSQFYAGPFADFGIKISKNCRRRYPNKAGERSYSGTFIMGVDIKDVAMQHADEEDDKTSQFD